MDPDLGDLAAPRGGRRRGRFVAPVDFVRTGHRDEVTATPEAEAEPTRVGSALLRVRRVLLGPPLALTAVAMERMRKLVALPILSSDALSSVAYGPEAMLVVLLLAGTGALDISLYLAVAIVVLMVAHRGLVPPGDQGVPGRRRLLQRRGREPGRGAGADGGLGAAGRLRADRRGLDLG